MRIYISGKISGAPFAETIRRFRDAEDMIHSMGFIPINPLSNGLPVESQWEEHMVKDIALLFESDGLLMLDGWENSDGASIEQYIAHRLGKPIWFQNQISRKSIILSTIKGAIHRVTGMHFEQYTTKSRKRDGFYARMLFAEHCIRGGLRSAEVARIINRDRTTVLHMLRVYKDDMRFNPQFRDIALEVEAEISKLKEYKNGRDIEKDESD